MDGDHLTSEVLIRKGSTHKVVPLPNERFRVSAT
jgi:hypothetical protein